MFSYEINKLVLYIIDIRKTRRLQQNRVSAMKCRRKKKEQFQMLSEEVLNLKARNSELTQQIQFLRLHTTVICRTKYPQNQLLPHDSEFIYLQPIPVQILMEDPSLGNSSISDYCTCPESLGLYSNSGRLYNILFLLNPLYRC